MVHKLLQYFATMPRLLVVGPEIAGHSFSEGQQTITGRTTPWNTLAVWDLNRLAKLGFPLIGDGTAENRSIGGVEVSNKKQTAIE